MREATPLAGRVFGRGGVRNSARRGRHDRLGSHLVTVAVRNEVEQCPQPRSGVGRTNGKDSQLARGELGTKLALFSASFVTSG